MRFTVSGNGNLFKNTLRRLISQNYKKMLAKSINPVIIGVLLKSYEMVITKTHDKIGKFIKAPRKENRCVINKAPATN